jgi:hypothetical protein
LPRDVSPLEFTYLSITFGHRAYAKEPFVGGKTRRGKFHLTSDPRDDLPFLWEVDRKRVHLDLNRNEDLTDDASTLSVTPLAAGKSKVAVTVHSPDGPIELKVVLRLHSYRDTDLSCSIASARFWHARVPLEGKDWQIAVAYRLGHEHLKSRQCLVVRPWSMKEEGLTEFCLASTVSRVFIDAGLYTTTLSRTNISGDIGFSLSLVRVPSQPGQLNFAGKLIQYALFLGVGSATESVAIVLDKPGDKIRLPVGTYEPATFWLGDGKAVARRGHDGARFTVTIDKPVTFASGGYLTNVVLVSRRGRFLDLNYQLTGADGGTYSLAGEGPRVAPRFMVFAGSKQVGDGQFEFG